MAPLAVGVSARSLSNSAQHEGMQAAPCPPRQAQVGEQFARACTLLMVLVLMACGGRPPVPKRGVVESDVGEWKFRRFQPVLDVEVWVPENKAEAFTATYVRDAAERRGRIEERDVVSVFVTRYQRAHGVVREVARLARRLAQEAGYSVEEDKIGGVRSVTIHGHGESWVMWAAGNHVVKVGGRGREEVPTSMVEHYGERYPSAMPGSVLEGPLPGTGQKQEVAPEPKKAPTKEPYDPKNPRPDWDGYDPKKPLPKAKDPK